MSRITFQACFLPLFFVTLTGMTLFGQDFPSIYNGDADQNASPMSATDAAARFQVPDGFHVGVFASEPDVQNPIAMNWDARGRMWVAENFTYADRTQRFDLSLRDRVLIFEDTNGDSVGNKRTVFTDQVQMLTSVEVGHGGVWLMCPPQLLFIPDVDQDDKPDGPAKVVLDGFDVAQDNYHNFANGLKWGPDGWLYGRCGGSCPGRVGVPGTPDDQRVALEGGVWRYHPQTNQVEVLTHGTTNPWGHDWNEFGDGFFINTVNGHLWHIIPGAHLSRPFTLDPNPHVYELIDMHADHWHFDTTGEWMESRDGVANSFGGGHAHSGMSIYLGDNWPNEYRGRLLTWNFHGRRANQELLQRHGSGYVGKHGSDTLLAADPFFRGIDLSYGPDGAVYVLDWSDTGECHEHTGVHRKSGRIYRVSYGTGTAERSVVTELRTLSIAQLAGLMTHRNEWFVRAARRVLVDRSHTARSDARRETDIGNAAFKPLEKMANGSDAIVAYRALVTLYAMGLADSDFLQNLLGHDNEHMRAWAIRLLTDRWPIDDVFGPLELSSTRTREIESECDELLEKLGNIARHDGSGLVRLALASTLQRMPVGRRADLAMHLMARAEDAEDHNLPLLVWYGISPVAKTDPLELAKLATGARWPKTQRLIARRLAESIEDHPGAVAHLLAHSVTASTSVRRNLLQGISDGLKGWSRAPEPKNWSKVAAIVETDGDEVSTGLIRELSVLFGDGRALEEVRRIVLDEEADIGIRRSALATFVNSNDPKVVEVCLPLLADQRINAIACKGIAQSSRPEVAQELIKNYRNFRGPERPQVIELLVSRPKFAQVLLNAIEAGEIPVADLTAFDVRQIRSLNVRSLEDQVSALWGKVRDSPEEKLQRIETLKGQLTTDSLANASPEQGRMLFNKSCVQCHRLFGHGEAVGPDLTGANRSNLDYLLENIVDPSAVVSKDFNMTVVLLEDGRVLNGLVISKNARTLTLQTQTERKTIELADIEEMRRTSNSPMPDGLLDNLSDDQIQDLVAYLMQGAQVSAGSRRATE